LNEVFAAGVRGASAKGTELLGKPVEIALKGVQQGGWDVAASLKEFTLAIPVSYGADVSGSGIVLMDARYAALVAELMFENDPAELPAELTELQKAAAAEALAQMISAMGESAGRAAKRSVSLAAGDLTILAGDGVSAARGVIKEDRIAIVDCELRIGSHPPSRLAHLLPSSLGDLLGSEKAGGTAGPDLTLGAAQPAGPGGGQRVQAVQFGTFGGGGSSDAPSQGNLDLLLDVPLDITAELGRTTRRVRDVLAMGPGSIVELDKMAGEPVDLLVNGKPIAKGEVVVIDENFAIRIIEILARDERLTGGL